MYATTHPPSIAIEDIVKDIFDTRQITRFDQQRFMMAALSDTLSQSDHALVNRVFDALQRGLLRVVD